mgnify:CR=1 FL=1
MQINRVSSYTPNFNARYQIDTSSAESRTQVFTLGMLMSNFWIDNARYTFTRIRDTNVFDTVEINTKDNRGHIIETILKNANIKFKKLSDY